jgi:hypothetical protein
MKFQGWGNSKPAYFTPRQIIAEGLLCILLDLICWFFAELQAQVSRCDCVRSSRAYTATAKQAIHA